MQLNRRVCDHLLFTIRVITFAICGFVAVSGHYPPALAQRARIQIEEIPVITTTDAMQNDHIEELNKHLQATDDNVRALQALTAQIASDAAVERGQFRLLIGIIALLSGAGVVIQIKRKLV